MDFSQFAEANFNAKQWINAAFAGFKEQQQPSKNAEQYAQSLLMKLQIFSREVNKSLEETSQQIVQTMPRILRDVDSMQQEAGVLQNRMRSAQNDVQKVEQETAVAMDSLLKIDTVKSRMQQVENALREMDNWTALTADIDDIFAASDNVDMAADRLVALEQCLSVLGNKVPDFKERRDYLENLKDQFLSAISPSVVKAFTNQHNENIQYFAKIFLNLDRVVDLQLCYGKCLKAIVCNNWREIEPELNDNSSESKAYDILRELHDSLLKIWFSQTKWAEKAFGENAPRIVASALAQALDQLEPPLEKVLAEKLTLAPDPMMTLCSLRVCCDNFANSLEHSFATANKTSGFMDTETLLTSVYRPLTVFAKNYQKYQQSSLLDVVNIWNFDDKDFAGNVTSLRTSVEAIFNEAIKAVERCKRFTGVVGLPFLLKALQTYFVNYLTKAKKIVSNPTIFSNITTDDENWTMVNQMLTLTSVCGDMLNSMGKLETELLYIYEKLLTHWPVNGEQGYQKIADVKQDRFEMLLMLNDDDDDVKNAVSRLRTRMGDVMNIGKFLPDIDKHLNKLCARVVKQTLELINGPVTANIETIPRLATWEKATVGEALTIDLPNFSLTPQEYITKVGQYLVTLAHHLEPYISAENAGMQRALRSGALPFVDIDDYLTENTTNGIKEEADEVIGEAIVSTDEDKTVTTTVNCSHQWARLWLLSSSVGIMQRLAEISLRIKRLSRSGAQQLAVDIDYLCNVVEDLGMTPLDNLLQLKSLLLMKPDELQQVQEGYPAPLLGAVREMTKVK